MGELLALHRVSTRQIIVRRAPQLALVTRRETIALSGALPTRTTVLISVSSCAPVGCRGASRTRIVRMANQTEAPRRRIALSNIARSKDETSAFLSFTSEKTPARKTPAIATTPWALVKDLCALGGRRAANTLLTCYVAPDPATQREALEKRRAIRSG